MNILFIVLLVVASVGCAVPKKTEPPIDLTPYALKSDVDAKMRYWGEKLLEDAKKRTDGQIRAFEEDCGCINDMK